MFTPNMMSEALQEREKQGAMTVLDRRVVQYTYMSCMRDVLTLTDKLSYCEARDDQLYLMSAV